ncbi:MAG: 50S ribosomal protein L29 [Ignavibacteriaceae bacterium]|nr:50S ribosomal protein L29 [Ignavibacteriaceae bacterium]
MKITEIRELTTDEIVKRIAEEENTLTDLRFSLALKQLDNTAKVTNSRKTIARLKTELNARKAAALKSGAAVK